MFFNIVLFSKQINKPAYNSSAKTVEVTPVPVENSKNLYFTYQVIARLILCYHGIKT